MRAHTHARIHIYIHTHTYVGRLSEHGPGSGSPLLVSKERKTDSTLCREERGDRSTADSIAILRIVDRDDSLFAILLRLFLAHFFVDLYVHVSPLT